MESLIKEAREIYDGNDIRELNEIYVKNKAIVEKLENLIPRAHKEITKEHEDHNEVATNQGGNIKFKADIEDITSFDRLAEIMKASVKEEKRVKAVGSFAAFSGITETNGYLLQTNKYTGISKTSLDILRENIKAQAEKDDIVYYDVKCGNTIKDVVKELKKDNRALFNLDGWGGQCIVSANATSTHGSGITLPPLHSFIVSVNIIAPGGKLYRIEPSKGITDPLKFRFKFPNISLIQDDETFNASIVHIGALGITYEITIYSISLYSIIQIREETTWNHAKSILKQKPYSSNPYLQYHNCEVWISPYTDYALITKRNIATQEDKKNYPKSEINMLFQEFMELPIVQGISKILNVSVGGALFLLLNLFPATVPSMIEIAERTQYHKDPIVDTYDNIYPVGLVNDFKVIAVEFSFSMKNDNHIAAIDAILQTLKKIREEDNLNINGPASLRFSAASSQYFSMAYNADNEPRAYLEMPILLYEPHIVYYKKTYDALLQTALKFNARCHWGQYFSSILDHQYLLNAYGAKPVSLFIKQIQKFDPQGIMSNDLLNHLGLTPDGKVVDINPFQKVIRDISIGIEEFWSKLTLKDDKTG
ncbi:1613_t:CDS:2 [Dentiscutata heterogama]|uniref:1613_t:CDS:1 n=1 Tax=Dentiscutata heterogama TaxID=1316150 RepID=A0ACA9KCE9_9GLOM|nr:1613_t:CDS:2 [Dentiscutata heterogama]